MKITSGIVIINFGGRIISLKKCGVKKFTNQKLHYIHSNPVEAEIVDKEEEYIYSSARDYSSNAGVA